MKIWFTSDTHFCHNREFLWQPRGFSSIEEHDKIILERWNSLINNDDIVYHLGDVILNDTEKGIEYLKQLKGHKHLIIGNHCTDNRIQLFKEDDVFESFQYATMIKYRKYSFYLSHYPTLCANYDDGKKIWNLHGHTHSKEKFSEFAQCYNVALDAHNNFPVEIEDIINDIKQKKGGTNNEI